LIYVVENGKAVQKEIKTGISDFDNIEILEGVNEGAEIVAGPYFIVSKQLKDGDLLKITKKD
jgi:HlyD family secretion protein